MNQGLLTGEKTAAVQKLLEALQQKKTTAVYDLPESQAIYLAALITRITGKRVLLVLPNDLAASKETEDAQQLVGNASACLPSGEIELGRGVSSHENTWRRLETLQSRQRRDKAALCLYGCHASTHGFSGSIQASAAAPCSGGSYHAGSTDVPVASYGL